MSTFPIYKQSKNSGLIVKFVGPTEGVVVETGSSTYSIGFKSNGW